MDLNRRFADKLNARLLARVGERVRLQAPGFDASVTAAVEEMYGEAGDDFKVSTALYTIDLALVHLPPAMTRTQMAELLTVTLLDRNDQVVKVNDVRGLGAGACQLVCAR